METVNDIIKSGPLARGMQCSNGVTDWRSLVWLFFSRRGVSFVRRMISRR